jgi:hypothetical protein
MKIRTVIVGIFVLVASWGIYRVVIAHARSRTSDSYAKATLVALKAVEGDIWIAEVRDGQILVNKETQQKIDVADAEASTKEERALIAELRTIFIEHLIGNLTSATNRLSGKDAANAAIVAREWACFKPFEQALRNRSASIPKECVSLHAEFSAKK